MLRSSAVIMLILTVEQTLTLPPIIKIGTFYHLSTSFILKKYVPTPLNIFSSFCQYFYPAFGAVAAYNFY